LQCSHSSPLKLATQTSSPRSIAKGS
jgi:hypothetical protein